MDMTTAAEPSGDAHADALNGATDAAAFAAAAATAAASVLSALLPSETLLLKACRPSLCAPPEDGAVGPCTAS